MNGNPGIRHKIRLSRIGSKWARVFGVVALLALLGISCAGSPVDRSELPAMTDILEETLDISPYPYPFGSPDDQGPYPADNPVETRGAGLPFPDPTETREYSPIRSCPAQGSDREFDPPSYESVPEEILEFINSGKSVEDLDDVLGWTGYGSVPLAVMSGEMTGDEFTEIVVSITDIESGLILTPGKLLIYSCSNGKYSELFVSNSSSGSGPPHLWYFEDLDFDGDRELVVTEATCGVNTCTENVRVLDWGGAKIVNMLNGNATDMPTPDIRLLESDGGNGRILEVASGGILSAGAGPQRTMIRRWELNTETGMFDISEEFQLPSNYRIHLLQDADRLVRIGDPDSALTVYSRVANDASLKDWQDPLEEQKLLGAYARFKMIVLYTNAGAGNFSDEIYSEMLRLYTLGTPSMGFVELAGIYRDGYSGGGMEVACRLVVDYAKEHESKLLGPLGSETFGYTNPDIMPEELCN